ncbi:MAG: type II secretion system protein M [Gammaproteobacteria bacterium]|jgi:general secretion pathway protein M
MKEWFNALAPRERLMVSIAAAVVVLALVYAAAWSPLTSSVDHLEQSVTEEQALKQWMQQSAAEVNRLRHAGGGAGGDHRSLLAVVDQTSKQSKVAPAVKRIEPDGQTLVRVTLEKAAFDDLVTWLGSLQRDFAVSVADVSIDRQADSGLVNVHLTLKRGEQ